MRPDKPQFWTGGDVNLAMTEMTTTGIWEPIKNLTKRTLVDVNIDCRGMLQGVARIIQDGEIIDVTTSRIQKNIFATPSQFLRFQTLSIPTGTFTSSGNNLNLTFGEAINPNDMLFNNDNTRLYVLQEQDFRIKEYELSTPYDISTAIYRGIVRSISNAVDMMYNNDGTRFFALRNGNADNIWQYELSTPYDISTATIITGGGFNVSTQDTSPRAIMFNNDGTKLYLLGAQHANIFEYELSIPYDTSTATYTRIVLNVTTQDTNPRDMMYNINGTRLYVLGGQNNDIFEYELSTPYDISTATYRKIALNMGSNPLPTSIMFNNDNTRLYVIYDAIWPNGNNRISEFLSSTIWTGNVKIRTINN